jgi:hypothetical protein
MTPASQSWNTDSFVLPLKKSSSLLRIFCSRFSSMAITHSVDENTIRAIFNQNDYWGRVKKGELTEKIQRQHHPSPPLSFVPFCTWSQMVSYHDKKGKKVAVVHQYLKPDGHLGASGKPDPKFVFHQGERYHLAAN